MDLASAPLATLGVVTDTHIPDRVNNLHPALIPGLRAAGVERILHAGDISIRRVLDELAEVAPVSAVQGNRDWLYRLDLPTSVQIEVAGVTVGLTHGHGTWFNYWWDKFKYVALGYHFERYRRVLQRCCPEAKIIVYGHTHQAENRREGGVLYFNPGSASFSFRPEDATPAYGLLRFYPGGRVEAEILPLTGAKVINGYWKVVGQAGKNSPAPVSRSST